KDAYKFIASPGEIVRIRMFQTSGSGDFNPRLELFDTQGVLLTNVTAGVDLVLERTVAICVTCFLRASADNGVEACSYNLSLQRLNQPVGAVPISYGQKLIRFLTIARPSDAYTFTAAPGELVRIRMFQTSGSGDFNP